MSARVVVLEDHPLVREALTSQVRAAVDEVDLVYGGASVPSAGPAVR